MKKLYFFFATIALVAIMVSFTPAIKKANSLNPTVTTGIPDDVKAILDKSCAGCHAEGGSKFAMGSFNLTNWDKYDPKKQEEKAAAICKMITKGKMPPKSIRKSKPELIPTQQQIDLICNWSKSFTK